MKTSLLTHSVLLLALSTVAASCSSSGSGGEPPPAPPQEAPEMSPEEMMAMFMKMAAPGPEHELLAGLAGDWSAAATSYMNPGAPPEESTGSMHNEMILGGRFLQGHYEGTAMGMPFSGMSLMGFDKGTGKYTSTWMDTFTTAILPLSSGEMGEDGVLTLTRTARDGMTGEMVHMKETMKIVSPDEHHFEMFRETPDGWALDLSIVYTRR